MSTKSDDAIEIPLQRPYGRMALGLAITAGLGAFMLHEAETNDRGLIINGIIHLDPGQADVFYVVMGILMLAFAGLVGLSFYAVATARRFHLTIGDEIRLPSNPPWKLRGEVAVPIDEVEGVELQPPQKAQVLVVVARHGRFALPVVWLPAGWTPTEVTEAIVSRARRKAGAG